MNICNHMLTSSTQLQNRSFHVVERTRTSSKCQKMKNAREKRPKILFFIVKYANLWGFCCRRRRGCLSSLFYVVDGRERLPNIQKWKSLVHCVLNYCFSSSNMEICDYFVTVIVLLAYVPYYFGPKRLWRIFRGLTSCNWYLRGQTLSSWEGITLETSTYLSSCCHSLTHIKSFGTLNVRVSLSHWRSTIFSSETKAVVRFVQLFTILCLALWYHNFETALVFLAVSRSTWLENDLPGDWSLEKDYWWRLTFSQPIRKPSSYIAKKIALKMAPAQVVQK